MMTHHDLVDPDLVDARHHRRETAALAVLLLALMVCLAYIVGGSYPEPMPCDPAACEVDE